MKYFVIHLFVVVDLCVLFWIQSASMVPKQNTQNIHHRQMNNGAFNMYIFVSFELRNSCYQTLD